ncbi:hypothetical protein BC936DRAFT_143048, partial [Jimgerdemannia flammicorona]
MLKNQENKKIWEISRRIASLNEESNLVDLELAIDKKKGLQAGLKIARRGFQLYSDIEFDTEERERKWARTDCHTCRPTKISSSIQAKTVEQLTSDEDQRSIIGSHEDNSGFYHSEFDLEGEERVEGMESDIEDEEVQEVAGVVDAVPELISSSSLVSVLKKHCAKPRTSKFDPARSFILDLTPTSKIINEFSSDEWTKLLTNKCVKASRYHHEIETITNKLFGPVGVR